MVFEAQIVLRRDSAQELAADYEAIARFIEDRRSGNRVRSSATARDAIVAAQRIVDDSTMAS